MWTPISNKDNLIAEMFRVAMALEKPWELTHIEFDDQDEAWHLFVNFEKGAAFACPNCGVSSKLHDTVQKHWRHLDFWNWKTYIHARVLERSARIVEKYCSSQLHGHAQNRILPCILKPGLCV